MNISRLQRTVFLLLLAAVTAAFVWVLSPFFGAVFWAVALTLLFHGVFERISARVGRRRNVAAILTLLLVILIVVVPMVLVGSAIIDELANVTQRVRSGEINFRAYFTQIVDAMPHWLTDQLGRFGVFNVQDAIDKISATLLAGGQALTTKVVTIGQNTLIWLVNLGIMLYLLFFFLRDGRALAGLIRRSTPMSEEQTQALLGKFATVVRATVKGTIVVALVQGVLGGLALWVVGIHGAVVWGALMALLSLVPAVGSALIWAPVAIYLLATGSIAQGVGLIAWGVLAIGMVDNLLRPILVGKDTKLPDWVVLLTTIGGISLMGISGFVIGPVIAALFMAAWGLFDQERGQLLERPPES